MSQHMFSGVSWRERPDTREQMFSAFAIVKQLHEMLWHLEQAQDRSHDADAADALASTIFALTSGRLDTLLSADVAALHAAVRAALIEVSEEVRGSYLAGNDHLDSALEPGADLAGADLRSRTLCGADLRGACLIGADLRGCDLTAVDVLGADLRDARLEGANLAAVLYLTQQQISSARGSHSTVLPTSIAAPPSWAHR